MVKTADVKSEENISGVGAQISVIGTTEKSVSVTGTTEGRNYEEGNYEERGISDCF